MLLRSYAARFRAWLLKRGRPVLPEYTPDRSTWWTLLRRIVLLAIVCGITFFYGLLVSVLPPFLLVPAAAPPAILTLLVIWALPEIPKPPVRVLTGAFLAFCVLMYAWPNYLAMSFGGLPWISVRRLVGILTAIVLLTCVSTSKSFRASLAEVLRASPWLSRMMIAFVAVQVAATASSDAIGAAINRMVDMQTTWTAMFFAAAWYCSKSMKHANRWVNLTIGVALFLMVMGAIEYRTQHVLWAGHIPSFLQIQDQAVIEILTAQFRDRYRVLTTLTSPLSYGEFLALVAPFFLHRLVNARNTKMRLFWVAMDVFLLLSAFLSGARLAMVGYIVAHAVYFFLWAARRWRTHPGGLIGPTLTIAYPALMAVSFIAIQTVPAIHNRVLGGGASQASNDARHEQFALAVPAVMKRPLFGYGPGGSGGAIGWFNAGGEVSVDSGYLTIVTEYGLLGFILFFGMIGLASVQTGRLSIMSDEKGMPLAAAASAAIATLLSTKLVLSQADNFPFIYMLLGLAIALIYLNQKSSVKSLT